MVCYCTSHTKKAMTIVNKKEGWELTICECHILANGGVPHQGGE